MKRNKYPKEKIIPHTVVSLIEEDDHNNNVNSNILNNNVETFLDLIKHLSIKNSKDKNSVLDFLLNSKIANNNIQANIDFEDIPKLHELSTALTGVIKDLNNLNSNLSNISFKFNTGLSTINENKMSIFIAPKNDHPNPFYNFSSNMTEARITNSTRYEVCHNNLNVNDYNIFNTKVLNPNDYYNINSTLVKTHPEIKIKPSLITNLSCKENTFFNNQNTKLSNNINSEMTNLSNTVILNNNNLENADSYFPSNYNLNADNINSQHEEFEANNEEVNYSFALLKQIKNPTIKDVQKIISILIKHKTNNNNIFSHNSLRLSYYSIYNIYLDFKLKERISELVDSKYCRFLKEEFLQQDKKQKFVISYKRSYALYLNRGIFNEANAKPVIKKLSKMGKVLFYTEDEKMVIICGNLKTKCNVPVFSKMYHIKNVIELRLYSNAGFLHDFYDALNSVKVDFDEELSREHKRYSLLIEKWCSDKN